MGRRLWSSFSSFSWCLHDGRDVLLSTALLYGSLSLFVSLLHNVFLLFYVETFVSVYKIDKVSFWVGETVFLLWNSLNDPLLGWLSDRAFLSSAPQGGGGGGSPPEVVLRRLRALSRNGPLLALSFLSLWVAWAPPGLQFLLCLCAYDGFLTAVDLNHAALLADLAVTHRDRMRLNFHCSLFSALGSASVFLSYVFWDKENLGWFRVLCVALASASALGFLGASRLLQRRFHKEARLQRHTEAQLLRELAVGQPSGDTQRSEVTLGQYLRQLSNNKNFLWFVSMNLVQVFHCHFNSNFFPLFLEHLLSDSISASTGSILLGVSYIAPHLNNMYFLTLCQRYGVYQVIRWLFVLKLGLSVAMMLAGADHTFLLCVFIASNRVFTEGTCKLLNLVISDLVDEDLVLNRRPQAASALLFGMVALGTKPGQTLAPLIGTWLLCAYTGYDIFERNDPVKAAAAAALAPAPPPAVLSGPLGGAPPPLRLGCFYMLVCVPITCALLQLAAWQRFTLHGRRLHLVKTQRTSQQQQGAPELPGDAQGEGGDAATTHLLDVKAV